MSNGHIPSEAYKNWTQGMPFPDEEENYDERMQELPESNENCMLCEKRGQIVKMRIYEEGYQPDNRKTTLVCPMCLFEQTD
jgi:hypothetical protein